MGRWFVLTWVAVVVVGLAVGPGWTSAAKTQGSDAEATSAALQTRVAELETQAAGDAATTPTPSPTSTPAPDLPEGIPAGSVPAKVTGAEDGEKLEVEIDGDGETVRFLGADAPEMENGDGFPECYAEEARDYLERMLKGRTVYLEQDETDEDDKDRLVRYVWFVGKSDGEAYLAQEQLLREGYLILKEEEEDTRYEDRLRDAEAAAKEAEAGLWGACGGGHVAITPVPELGEREAPAPIGTTLNTEGQDITVASAIFTYEYNFSTPKGGYVFLVLDVRIENVDAAKKDHGYGENRFSAKDLDTEAEFDDTFALVDVPLGSGELSPGEYVTGQVVLEVQETSTRIRIKYDANFTGGSEVYWVVQR